MSDSDEFSRLSIHKSFSVPAKGWEAQQEGRALVCECDSPILALMVLPALSGCGQPGLAGSRCVRSALGRRECCMARVYLLEKVAE